MSKPEARERPEWMNLSDEFENAIGRMIVTFAHLEGNLRSLICALLGGNRMKVLALVSSLDFRKLVAALSAQVHLVTKELKEVERMKAWMKRAESVAFRRNRFVHDQLVFLSAGRGSVRSGQYRLTTKKGEFKSVIVPVDLKDVRQLSQDAADLVGELVTIHDDFVKFGFIARGSFDGMMRNAK